MKFDQSIRDAFGFAASELSALSGKAGLTGNSNEGSTQMSTLDTALQDAFAKLGFEIGTLKRMVHAPVQAAKPAQPEALSPTRGEPMQTSDDIAAHIAQTRGRPFARRREP